MNHLRPLLPFLEALESLKTLRCASWYERGFSDADNVGNHIYRMAWLCYSHPRIQGEEESKAVMMCLVHDVGGITTGDITPADGVTPERKRLEEGLSLQYFSCLLAKTDPKLASTLSNIWLEYEESATDVAKLVRQIDKLECLHQAFMYHKRHKGGRNLKNFQDYRLKITDAWLAGQADHILSEWAAMEDDRAPLHIVFIIGGPGVGKGTLCSRISQAFDFEHISVGDLLRGEQDAPGSTFGNFIATSIRHSVIVPPSLTLLLLKNKIQAAQDQGRPGLFIDGFPRSVAQALAFEQEVGKISTMYSTIYLDCDPETMVQRVRHRSASSAREDDNMTSLSKRIDTFLSTNSAVLDHLSRNRVVKLDCAGSADDVFIAAKETIEGLVYA